MFGRNQMGAGHGLPLRVMNEIASHELISFNSLTLHYEIGHFRDVQRFGCSLRQRAAQRRFASGSNLSPPSMDRIKACSSATFAGNFFARLVCSPRSVSRS